jgi:hypothetical protein
MRRVPDIANRRPIIIFIINEKGKEPKRKGLV